MLELDGQPLELPEGEILLGRSRSCTVTLPDPSISRQHAKLLLRHGQVRLRDLNSANGTYLNDSRVHTETDVVDGDRIVLGETEMRFRAAAPDGQGPATQPVVPAPAAADAEEEAPTVRGVSSDVSRARHLGPKAAEPAPPVLLGAAPPVLLGAVPPVLLGALPDPGSVTPRPSEVVAPAPRQLVSASTRPRTATVEPLPAVPPAVLGAALRPAGFWVRTLAVLIDSLWIGALVGLGIALPILLDLPASLASAVSAGAGVLSAVLVIAGWAKWGTTPGKRLLGLYVCQPGGPPGIGVGRAVLRWLACMLSMALLGVGFLLVAFSKDKRGLHDLIAGTAVGRR